MKSTIHETARRRLVFRDASRDFVDRPPPSKQKNFKMTPLPTRNTRARQRNGKSCRPQRKDARQNGCSARDAPRRSPRRLYKRPPRRATKPALKGELWPKPAARRSPPASPSSGKVEPTANGARARTRL